MRIFMAKVNMAHIEGNHCLFADEELLDLESVRENMVYAQMITVISARRYEFLSTLQNFNLFLRVESGNEISTYERDGYKEIAIGVEYFAESDIYKAPRIIFEDVNDDPTYRMISNWAVSRFSSIQIMYEVVNGGGSNTSKTIEYETKNLSNKPRIVMCLYDSDIKFPNGKLGDTAKGIISVSKTITSVLYSSYRIDAHEVENLYSFRMLDKIVDDVNAKEIKNLVQVIEQKSSTEYLDLKNGIRRRSILHPISPHEKPILKRFAKFLD